MAPKLGCNATYCGEKCLSVTTGVQHDGTYEFFVHGLAGPGVERHVHGFAEVSPEGVIVNGGARVKENVDQHLSAGIVLSNSTQEIARVKISPTDQGLATQFRQREGDHWLETSESTFQGVLTRTEVPLPSAVSHKQAEYSTSMCDARSAVPSDTSTQVSVPFSAPLPFGILFRSESIV